MIKMDFTNKRKDIWLCLFCVFIQSFLYVLIFMDEATFNSGKSFFFFILDSIKASSKRM